MTAHTLLHHPASAAMSCRVDNADRRGSLLATERQKLPRSVTRTRKPCGFFMPVIQAIPARVPRREGAEIVLRGNTARRLLAVLNLPAPIARSVSIQKLEGCHHGR